MTAGWTPAMMATLARAVDLTAIADRSGPLGGHVNEITVAKTLATA